MSAIRPVRVALVGLMGAGKSRVGVQLARKLGWPCHDTDRMIEEETGKTLPDLFRDESEAGFRDRETRCLHELAETPPPLVAALGGGVVIREENRTVLEDAFHVVWLRIDPEEAVRRIGEGKGRPLLEGGHPREVLNRLQRERAPLYSQVADQVIDTGSDTPLPSLVGAILESLPVDDRHPL